MNYKGVAGLFLIFLLILISPLYEADVSRLNEPKSVKDLRVQATLLDSELIDIMEKVRKPKWFGLFFNNELPVVLIQVGCRKRTIKVLTIQSESRFIVYYLIKTRSKEWIIDDVNSGII